MDMMKALVFPHTEAMELQMLPIPKPAKNQVLLRIHACGICGTDPHILHGHYDAAFPLVPGHEASGEVVEVGEACSVLKVGDRVTVDPNVGCGYCDFCHRGLVHLCKNQKPFGVFRNGGFAEYAVIEETHAYKIPDNVSYEEAALVEPAACALRGLQMSQVSPGSTALIHGVGPMGQLNLQWMRAAGATTLIVSDPQASRREIALKLGADYAFDPTACDLYAEVRKLLPDGPDVIMDCSGIPALLEPAIYQVRRGGRVVFFGCCPLEAKISVSPMYINDNEITICGSYNNPFTHEPAIRAIASGRINVKALISHKFSLDEYKTAFDMFGKPGTAKLLICP